MSYNQKSMALKVYVIDGWNFTTQKEILRVFVAQKAGERAVKKLLLRDRMNQVKLRTCSVRGEVLGNRVYVLDGWNDLTTKPILRVYANRDRAIAAREKLLLQEQGHELLVGVVACKIL